MPSDRENVQYWFVSVALIHLVNHKAISYHITINAQLTTLQNVTHRFLLTQPFKTVVQIIYLQSFISKTIFNRKHFDYI